MSLRERLASPESLERETNLMRLSLDDSRNKFAKEIS